MFVTVLVIVIVLIVASADCNCSVPETISSFFVQLKKTVALNLALALGLALALALVLLLALDLRATPQVLRNLASNKRDPVHAVYRLTGCFDRVD